MMQLLPSLLLVLLLLLATTLASSSSLPAYCGSTRPVIPSLQTPNYDLKAVQVLIRHGDRFYAQEPQPHGICWTGQAQWVQCGNDSSSLADTQVGPLFRKQFMQYTDTSNCVVGQLTQRGYSQQLAHGAELRAAYAGLLAPLTVHDVYVRADDVPRTQMSAEGLILGMFPNTTNTPPPLINIHMLPIDDAVMFPNPAICPALSAQEAAAQASPPYQQFVKTVAQPLIEELSGALNMTITFDNAGQIFDCALVQVCHGEAVAPPLQPSQPLFQKLVDAYTWLSAYPYTYPSPIAAGKLHVGPLVREINARFATRSPPFALYSGHDSTVMPFLGAFGVFNESGAQWSPYASLISIEQYAKSGGGGGTDAVRFVYNGQVLHPTGCPVNEELCPVDAFQKLLDSLTPTKADCPNLPFQYTSDDMGRRTRHTQIYV